MLSAPCEVERQLFFHRQAAVHRLLRALNRQNQEASDLITLLESLADTVHWALDPTGCIIWLRQDPSAEEGRLAAWIGARPPSWLVDNNYQPCVQPRTLTVTALRDTLLRTALLKAGMSLVTPMIHQDTVIGWLSLGPPQTGREYPAETCYFLELLACQATMAIHSLRLKTKLESSLSQLRRAYQQILQAQEKERRHLAGILHDETLQHLADLSVRLGLLRRQSQVNPADLDDLQRRLTGTDRRLREIVRGVHPAILSDLGLIEAVIAFLETLPPNHDRSPVRVELWVTGFDEQRLPDQGLELALYRFAQNATLNALAHGKPGHIKLEFKWGSDLVEVHIEDDGCGMKLNVEEAARAGHFGLLTMRERIEAFSGRFALRSKPGRGTQVSGRVPLKMPSLAPRQVRRYTFEL